jgi:hypothetical protein
MENQEKRVSHADNDMDLGSAMLIIGRGFKSIGRFFANIFTAFVNFILYFLLFLKRRLWWLIGALVIGLALGTYLNKVNGTMYYSVMTARYNFGSTRALYNTVDYLNALIGERRLAEIGKILSISPEEARSVKFFSAHPLQDEKIIADLYNDYYLTSDRSFHIRTDTFWTRTIRYKDFKDGLTKYDLPVHQLIAYSNRSDIFPKIQNGLINAIVGNGSLKKNEEISKKIQEEDEQMLVSSIQGLDTLRMVYNERLRKIENDPETGATNLTLLDKATQKQNPELELYDKFLQFKDELKAVRRNTLKNQEIVQVSASFNPVGKKLSILRQSVVTTTARIVVLVLVILLFVELYIALGSYEKKKKAGVTT